MQRVQREVVMAHLALMHMAASDISLLELATQPEQPTPFTRKRLKGRIEELAAQSPVSTTSLALARTSPYAEPIFTSRAQKEAWERQQGLIAGGEGQ
ncbi:MAG: hypothetical protein LAN62_18690, partial [Acidobacteriia bacterium]|nr:hypothetical protein [Terriglobia bacterium]